MSDLELTAEEEVEIEKVFGELEEYENLPEAETEEKEEQKTLEGKEADPALVNQSDEKTAERYQDILVGVGFRIFDNKEKGIACKLKTKEMLIGRTFTKQQPTGKFWAKCLEDCDYGKKSEFVATDRLKELQVIALFYRIRDGELEIPETEITGKIVGKTEKAIQVQFMEFEQIRTEWWGLGALKKNDKGDTFIPAGFSKQTEKYEAKMQIPRDIILSDYEEELEKAPQQTTANGHQTESEEGYIPEDVEAARHEKEETNRTKEVEEAKAKVTEEVKNGGKQIRSAIEEGLAIVIDVFSELKLTDYEKADLATRIGQGINIDVGKNRRTPKY